jgi:hypothetical protein
MATSELLTTPRELGSDWTDMGHMKVPGNALSATLPLTVTWPDEMP